MVSLYSLVLYKDLRDDFKENWREKVEDWKWREKYASNWIIK